jgi:hypothetical protein
MLKPINPLKLCYIRDGIANKCKFYFYSVDGRILVHTDHYKKYM